MSDEDLPYNDDTSDGEDDTQEVSPETPSDDAPNTYCTVDDVNSMFGDISDEVSEVMFNTAIGNATTWIEANLKRNYVPIPTSHPASEDRTPPKHICRCIFLAWILPMR